MPEPEVGPADLGFGDLGVSAGIVDRTLREDAWRVVITPTTPGVRAERSQSKRKRC